MGIKEEYAFFKARFQQGSELMLLRLRLLRLDLEGQLRDVLRIVALLAISAVLLLVGLLALLLGLNVVLPENAKIWVFFGTAAMCILMVVVMLLWITRLWRQSSARVGDTLADMQQDWARLSGRQPVPLAEEMRDEP